MVEPYIEAISFIGKDEEISNIIKLNNKLKNKFKKKSIEETINEKVNKLIDGDDPDNEDELKKSLEYQENPEKIFNFIIDDLHKIFNEKNNLIRDDTPSVNINTEVAKKLFEEKAENEKSIISDLYFGRKQISKFCKNCKMTQFSYNYQKTIVIDLDNFESDIDLEEEIYNKINKIYKKEFCSFCSSKQNFIITKKMSEKPKIMIIVIKNVKNNVRVNFTKKMFDNKYKLIGIETSKTHKSNIFGLFFRCFKPAPITYQFLSNNDIEMDKIERERAYVLYYKKIKTKPKRVSSKKSVKIDLKSKEKLNNNNENNIIFKKKKVKKPKKFDNSLDGEETTDNNINIINDNNKKSKITLYFKFIKTGKELYIDTFDNKTFKEIISELKKRYKLIISINDIEFNSHKINLNKNPKFYGIKNEDVIIVKN